MLAGTVALANIRQTKKKLMVGFDPNNEVIPSQTESLVFFPWQNSEMQMLASVAHSSCFRRKSEPKHLELWKQYFFTHDLIACTSTFSSANLK